MRPNTLAEAVERIQAGLPRDAVLAEFVDSFDLAKISPRPTMPGSPRSSRSQG